MNAVPPSDTMSLWSEEECRAFETGLRVYGKDFYSIKNQKVSVMVKVFKKKRYLLEQIISGVYILQV